MNDAQEMVMKRAAEFRAPLLVMTGSEDPVADPAAGQAFYQRTGAADKTLKSYPNLLHELLREREREAVFSDVMTWIGPRL
jgi:alpha-beta hydrolase superfamily lysophospholipase